MCSPVFFLTVSAHVHVSLCPCSLDLSSFENWTWTPAWSWSSSFSASGHTESKQIVPDSRLTCICHQHKHECTWEQLVFTPPTRPADLRNRPHASSTIYLCCSRGVGKWANWPINQSHLRYWRRTSTTFWSAAVLLTPEWERTPVLRNSTGKSVLVAHSVAVWANKAKK